jgi:CheY-like chemotaxis protein
MKKFKKILLVDDDAGFNFLNRITLQENGIDCPVDIALNGKEALQYISASPGDCPDVILLDLNMPVMDGFEFLGKFQKQALCCSNSRVFVLSSSEREEDKYKTMSQPVVKGFFSKPLSPDDIKEIMEHAA